MNITDISEPKSPGEFKKDLENILETYKGLIVNFTEDDIINVISMIYIYKLEIKDTKDINIIMGIVKACGKLIRREVKKWI